MKPLNKDGYLIVKYEAKILVKVKKGSSGMDAFVKVDESIRRNRSVMAHQGKASVLNPTDREVEKFLRSIPEGVVRKVGKR